MVIKGDRISFFKALYEESRSKGSALHEKLKEYVDQYKGTRFFGRDNPGAKPADVVRNITYELIESQVDTNIPPSRVDAERWSPKNGRNAKMIERLCNNIRNKLPTEEYNDLDERYTYVAGGSVWTVEFAAAIAFVVVLAELFPATAKLAHVTLARIEVIDVLELGLT